MSTIPTKHIDGDVTVGRNVTAGGNAEVQGSARIGHDLKVEGWLEAKNIKSANKGLYTDPTKLREAYPRPHDGWFAGVSATAADFTRLGVTEQQGISYFVMYVGDGGEWVSTDKLYQIVVDNEQVDNLREDLTALQGSHNTLSGRVDGHDTQISQLQTNLTSTNALLTTTTATATEANNRSRTNETDIAQLRSDHTADVATLRGETTAAEGRINAKIGAAGGIAPLDGTGRVPAANLPGYVDDVVEFDSVEDSGITIQTSEINKLSTDADCAVFYDTASNKFVLGVMLRLEEFPGTANHTPTPMAELPEVAPKKITIGGIETELTKSEFVALKKEQILSATTVKELNSLYRDIYSVGTENNFTADDLHQFKGTYTRFFLYYDKWIDRELYADNNLVPHSGKVYVATETNKQYRWSGTTLTIIGSDLALGQTAQTAYPGDRGKALENRIETAEEDISLLNEEIEKLALLPFNGIVYNPEEAVSHSVGETYMCVSLKQFIKVTAQGWEEQHDYNRHDRIGTCLGPRTDALYKNGCKLYKWNEDEEYLEEFASKAEMPKAIGNCYNVTAARAASNDPEDKLPTSPMTYDTKQSAIEFAIRKEAVGIGVQITFAASEKGWRTFQYIGLTDHPDSYINLDNWLDVAGQSAGEEPMLNINKLCYDLTLSNEYTLLSAVAALRLLKQSKAIDYLKDGLVITYCTNATEHEWETKQLLDANAADSTDAWIDYGTGGSTLEASDTPVNGGTDAFSTGGAYKRLIVDFEESFNNEGTAKVIQPVNALREPVGSSFEIPLGGGGGSADGTSFNVRFENQTIYGASGGRLIGRFAARSVTRMGDEEVVNNITQVQVEDTNTGVVLGVYPYTNERSSATLQDYKFSVDFSPWFNGAGQRGFIVQVTDQTGLHRRIDVSVNSVDVTVEVCKNLNECRVTAGAGMTTLNGFYIFPNNTLGGNGGGIDAIVEILYEGEWHELGRANVQKTFSQDISINPSNVLGGGERLQHGSYLLRIHGYAPQARVTGNYVYTSIMCIDSNHATEPVVAIRYNAKTYNDALQGQVMLYDSVKLQVAAYTQASVSGNTAVTVKANGETIQTFNAAASSCYEVTYQVQGYGQGDVIEFNAEGEWREALGTIHRGESHTIGVEVAGSAIDVQLKGGAHFCYDFALRTNADVDKTITDNGITMSVNGANWRTNGFVEYLGENSLRIAENMTAQIPYRPFSQPTSESAGLAVQFAFATANIKNKDALLLHSYDPTSGTGFYVKGNVAGIYCSKGVKGRLRERKFRCGEKITMAVVVEPSSKYYERGDERYSTIKMYLNGEEVACLGYIPGQNAISQNRPIELDGHDGDLYLYYMMAYQSHYEWEQAFNNYLGKLTNIGEMMEEFASEDVLDNMGRPSLDKIKGMGIPYYIIVAPQETFDTFDSDTDTSAKFTCDVYYYNPQYPCLNAHWQNAQWRRQGTTSAKRPIKNDRFYTDKQVDKKNPLDMRVTLLNPDEDSELGRKAIELAHHGYVMLHPEGIPVKVITVKVDFSDSSNANDCGVCDMMNATFRALGNDYMTPAQRAFDGTFTVGDYTIVGLKMDHSTKNHPIAVFRSTNHQFTDAWFHSKGNWKEDKGEQVALGFKDTPGYNKGCLNYGDFVEFFGTPNETLDQIEARFKTTAGLKTDKLYLLSQYCGRDYRFMEYSNGTWQSCTGSMRQNAQGKWVITGKVLNPVCGFELLSYQELCWWKGVSSVADMMAPIPASTASSWVQKLIKAGSVSADTYPKWTQYFECMIDDDQLQIDLALGKKVPYELYRMLKFCDECDMVQPVENSSNRFQVVPDDSKITNWRNNLWKYASPQSVDAYTLFTDYLAATDQRAKNMQPMWFLEDGSSVTDGVYSSEEAVRMYLNKVYDCDTCNGQDNDGDCSVDSETDPNKFTDDTYTNPYAGYGSILFTNVNLCNTVYLDGSHSSSNQLSLRTVAETMRNAKTMVDGVQRVPFSPEGADYFFVQKRLKFWKKLISSFDGERKYIESVGRSDDIYFYALQGLRLTALPQFIEQRWRIRDGYYQTGQFFSGVLSGRTACASENARIRIKAAKPGYFGIGHDASGQLDEVVFLEAGEEHYFTQFSHTEYALLYIYQADRMSEIDLSEISIDSTFNFDVMKLAEKIFIGSEEHVNVSIGSATPINSVQLGALPFLTDLDLRNTTAESVNASQCPRIESILAEGTPLQNCVLAETSPIDTLHLPATITELSLVNLPNLSYPGGMTIEGMGAVSKIMVSGCPKIDAMSMIARIVSEAGQINAIGLRDVNITASVEILRSLKATHAYGLDENGNDIATDKDIEGVGKQCSGLTGRWILSELIEEEELAELQAYFPALGSNLYNSQFSIIKFNNAVEAPNDKITNLDNKTGADYNCALRPSGHPQRIRERTHTYKAMWNSLRQRMELRQLSDSDFNFMADGSEIDLTDNAGTGYDIMWLMAHCWYKGVDDYKNEVYYNVWSSCDDEPLSTANVRHIYTLADLLYAESNGVNVEERTIADATGIGDALVTASNMNVYRVDVEGMKQVRFPGINSSELGGIFTNAEGEVVGSHKMSVRSTNFDFEPGKYLFDAVPQGAKWFYFTCNKSVSDSTEVHTVDSDSIEAIEPEWIEHKAPLRPNEECDDSSLIGNYPITIDGFGLPRSISGNISSRCGTGTSATNPGWIYDENGIATEKPSTNLNYTMKDFQNLARLRGEGYQLEDYEQSKESAILWWALNGNTDEQSVVGRGQHNGRLNQLDSIGMADSTNTGNVWNSIMGLKGYVGCDSEWMDNIAVNVTTFKEFLSCKGIEHSSFPIDNVAHIYDPATDTERTVKLPSSGNGNNVVRIVNGKHCDILPARTTADTSQYVTGYCAGYWYSASRSRAVLRSGGNSYASGGFVFAGAGSAASYSGAIGGARLAFRGRVIVLS